MSNVSFSCCSCHSCRVWKREVLCFSCPHCNIRVFTCLYWMSATPGLFGIPVLPHKLATQELQGFQGMGSGTITKDGSDHRKPLPLIEGRHPLPGRREPILLDCATTALPIPCYIGSPKDHSESSHAQSFEFRLRNQLPWAYWWDSPTVADH